MIWLFHIGFLEVGWVDILDITLVSFLLYQVYKNLKNSLALRLGLALLFLYFVYLVVKVARMELLTSLLGQLIGLSSLGLLIVFQQEIRRYIFTLAKTDWVSKISFLNGFISNNLSTRNIQLSPIIEAAKVMAANQTGALIVFAKNSDIKFYADSGDQIDALISKRLLLAIFNKNSPLHDGAVIIANGKIKAARCVLPVNDDIRLPAQYGLRHRAAVSLTEYVDSVVFLVSEETGNFAIAHNGKLETNLNPSELKKMLQLYLNEAEEEQDAEGIVESQAVALGTQTTTI